MKKNYFFKFVLFLIPVSAFMLMSSSGGRNDGRTGSPGDSGATCSECHTGGSSGTSVAITTNIPASGYVVNTEYDVTVTLSSSTSTSGFQLTAEKVSDNAKIGSFTAGTGSRVSNQRVTQNGTGLKTWNFKWTSPATAQSQVKFYAAAVAANGNGSPDSGDRVATTSTSVGALGINQANRLDFSMYPNPTSAENVTIQLPTGTLNANVDLYDISGRLIKSQKISTTNNKVSVQNLSNGIYVLKVAAEGKLGAKKFVKK